METIPLFIITLTIWSCNGITRPTDIVLENNGYKKILVAIHPSIQEDANLITNIKDMLIHASSDLYEATLKRAYFQEVTILVPSSWSGGSSYSPASSQIYDNADIEFTSRNPRHGRQPHSRSFSGCGSPGIRIHFTPDVFNTTESNINGIDTLGPRGILLVHKWANFRWGVFKETADPGEQQFYYSPTAGKLQGVRCNINLRGLNFYIENGQTIFCRSVDIDKITGRYDDRCLFYLHPRQKVDASIMSNPRRGIKHFCNDDTSQPNRIHNTESPSKQNRMCGQRSTWSVILDSQDFKDNKNPPRDVPDTTPTFTVVKAAATRRVALVLDQSSKLLDDDSDDRVRQAAADFIHTVIGENTEVGIVSFSNETHILHPMTTIKTQSDRERLKRSLPRTTGGSTSIGAGVDKAIELLSRDNQIAQGAEIVLLTNGEETAESKIRNVLPKLKTAGVILTVLKLNQPLSELLSDVAHSSGGRFYFDNNNEESTSLTDGMFKIRQDPNRNIQDNSLQLLSRAGHVQKDESLSGKVSIDKDVGRNTVFTVMYQKEEPTITITSPTDRVFNHRYPEYKDDHNYNTIRIEIPEIAETGLWTFKIRNDYHEAQKISTSIVTEPIDGTREEYVTVDAAVSSITITSVDKLMIWAEVTKGYHSVTGMKVTAIIDRPFADAISIELLDNGAGADITKNDGVYCRYFTKFSGFGRYSIKIEVEDKADQSTVRKSIIKVLDSPFIDKVSGIAVRDKREVSLQPLMMSVSRSTTAGSFHYKSLNISSSSAPDDLEADMLAPVRITDLTVMKTSHQDQTIMLSWTAPGDDLDFDTAFRYDIVMSHNTEDMIRGHKSMRFMSQEEIIHGNLMAPKEAGTQETFIIKVPFSPGTKISFVFSVRAVDEKGNMGDKSNYATAGFGYVPDYINKEYRPIMMSPVTEKPTISSSIDTQLLVVVVVGSGSVILLLIVSLLMYKRNHRR